MTEVKKKIAPKKPKVHLRNGIDFFGFCLELRGLDVYSKKTNRLVPKYILFWNDVDVKKIKIDYNLKDRPPHYAMY